MTFKLIDLANWPRKEYFEHYMHRVPCTYSITIPLDITVFLDKLKKKNIRFYPAMIYALSVVVNKHPEFRTALDEQGNLGIFDVMHPAYVIFNLKHETFSSIWTAFEEDFSLFYQSFLTDTEKYKEASTLFPKPNMPLNTFNISSYPWHSFTALNLNLSQDMNYLLSIFTLGKYTKQSGKIILPLAIQVHHAVCDGFHVSRFVDDLIKVMNEEYF